MTRVTCKAANNGSRNGEALLSSPVLQTIRRRVRDSTCRENDLSMTRISLESNQSAIVKATYNVARGPGW